MNNRIKEFRARFNLTQEELAKKVNVRRETIVFLEKNKYNPSLKLAHDIAGPSTQKSKKYFSSIEEIIAGIVILFLIRFKDLNKISFIPL